MKTQAAAAAVEVPVFEEQGDKHVFNARHATTGIDMAVTVSITNCSMV